MDADDPRPGLVAAARAYFLKHGFSKTSTAEIASVSGRSTKTLFKHFPTKQDLLRAVLADASRQAADQALASIADRGREPRQRIRAFLVYAGTHLATLHSRLFPDLERTDARLAANLRQQQRSDLAALIERLLAGGQVDGVIGRGTDLATATRTFIATVEGLARQIDADDPLEPHVERTVDWMLAGLSSGNS